MTLLSQSQAPLLITIVDQGNIFRSVVAKHLLRQAIMERIRTSGYHLDPHEYPGIRAARVKEKKPQHENITEYDFWKRDEAAFEQLFENEFGIPIVDLKAEESVLITEDMVRESAYVYGISDQDVSDLEARFTEHKGKFQHFSELAAMDQDFVDPSTSLTVDVAREMMIRLREICEKRVDLFPELRDLVMTDELSEEKRGIE